MEFLPAIKCLYSESTQQIIRAINSAVDLEDYKEILEKVKERSSFEYVVKKGNSFHYSCLIHTGFSFYTQSETEYELFYDFAYEFLVLQKAAKKNIKKLGLHYALLNEDISTSSNMVAKIVNLKESKWKLVDLKDKNNAMLPLEIVGKKNVHTQETLTKEFENRLSFLGEERLFSLDSEMYINTYEENEDTSHIDFSNRWIDWYCKRFD